jgi:hypothetical protein
VDWSQVGGYEDWQLCGVFPSGLGLIKPDVCAPGERVQSTRLGGLYTGESEDGTSFAAPHVAGLAALILSFEDQLSTSLVHSFIEGQAVDLGPFGKDNGYGSGKIDCEASVAATTIVLPDLYDLESHTLFDASGGNGDGRMDAGETAFLGMEIHNNGAAPIQRVRARLETASPFVTVLDDSVFLGDLAPDSTLATGADRFEIEILPNAPEGRVDTFYVRLSGFSSNGSVSFADTLHNPNSVGVPAPPPAILRLGLAVRPNPARGEARLSLELPSSCRAKVVIHDVQGRALRTLTDGWMTGGRQELSWDGRDDRGRRLGAGLYFARCSSNSGAIGRRFVMLGR